MMLGHTEAERGHGHEGFAHLVPRRAWRESDLRPSPSKESCPADHRLDWPLGYRARGTDRSLGAGDKDQCCTCRFSVSRRRVVGAQASVRNELATRDGPEQTSHHAARLSWRAATVTRSWQASRYWR